MDVKQPSNISQITVYVEGGIVQAIYTNLPGVIKVNMLDFDNERTESESALDEAIKTLNKVQHEQRMIY